jgi:hypothetical protein
VPEAVSLLLALVCTVAIVTLFLRPLWAPLLRARRARCAAIARFVQAVDRGDFTRADAAAARLLDRHRRAPRHSAG